MPLPCLREYAIRDHLCLLLKLQQLIIHVEGCSHGLLLCRLPGFGACAAAGLP